MPPLAARSALCSAALSLRPPTVARDASTTRTGWRRARAASMLAAKRPLGPVAPRTVYRSTATRAPCTGRPSRRIRPGTAASFELPPCQSLRPTALPSTTIRGFAAPARVTVRATAGAAAGAEVTWKPEAFVPAAEVLVRDEFFAPLSAKTCSSEAVPPFDEVGVPPTVTATDSLSPGAETHRGPGARGAPR